MNPLAMSAQSVVNSTINAKALWAAIEKASGTIAPSWPLDQAVGVNPHWYRVGEPLRRVAARLAVLGDFRVFPSRTYIGKAWRDGRISLADLTAAIEELSAHGKSAPSAARCVEALSRPLEVTRAPLLIDLLEDPAKENTHWPWREGIVFQLSQTCATYFDRDQADWQATGSADLFGFWRESIHGDHGVSSMLGLSALAQKRLIVPVNVWDAAVWAMSKLNLPERVWCQYFEALLLSINGWASWCSYVRWQNIPSGNEDQRLNELLVCRLVWEALIAESVTHGSAEALQQLREAWLRCDDYVAAADDRLRVDEVWQRALEVGYQRTLVNKLQVVAAPAVTVPEVQAVFCIDTRSELMRRAIESLDPAVETRAFAGFFGIPMAYNPIGTDIQRPQLPGLAYPNVTVSDRYIDSHRSTSEQMSAGSNRVMHSRWRRLGVFEQWLGAVRWPSSTFSFVEAVGVGYLGKIAHWIRPPATSRRNDDGVGIARRHQAKCRPVITALALAQRIDLAADILHSMGIDDRLAPLVVLCGHAAHTTNNAHASTLDCGACYGRPGEANARALAQLLNDPEVRAGLEDKGLIIPPTTEFMGALHNTTTDEVTGFDLDLLSPAGKQAWKRVKAVFAAAGDQVRRERAATLWMNPQASSRRLLKAFRRRANDGAQTRPEWGLTRNAAFIIAPRWRTQGKVLSRCYLHDYDAAYDADGSVLEKLLMGPTLVCHWLGWQYHASTCDPLHYGSGNKVLHNVVGGHIGVFEGNGGDLRIGLPKQSLHDGKGWYHEPVRLTVIVDAAAETIDTIIGNHPVLADILHNDWMLLWRYEGDELLQYRGGDWLPLSW